MAFSLFKRGVVGVGCSISSIVMTAKLIKRACAWAMDSFAFKNLGIFDL